MGTMDQATAPAKVPPHATTVTPREAAGLAGSGSAFIVDVREPDEHRREHVAGASLHPSSSFSVSGFPAAIPGRTALILCRSGTRASKVAAALRTAGRTDVAVIDGGIVAWAAAGLPVVANAKAPVPLVRQVMMAAGAMLVTFTALAALVNPWFLAGTGFVGMGLFIAGLTGICPMATVLSKMPWNRATAAPQAANKPQTACSSESCCS